MTEAGNRYCLISPQSIIDEGMTIVETPAGSVHYTVPLIAVHTPLSVNNPVITVFSRERRRADYWVTGDGGDIRVDIEDCSGRYCREYVGLFEGFLERVLGEMGVGGGVRLSTPIYALGEYAAVTTLLLVDMGLGERDAVELGVAIDRDIGLDEHYTYPLRKTVVMGSPLIIRGGEKPYSLRGLSGAVSSHILVEAPEPRLDEDLFVHLTHLGGYNAISLARCILSGKTCRGELSMSLRIVNALYYILYNVNPILDTAMHVYSPDIAGYLSVVAVSLDERGADD